MASPPLTSSPLSNPPLTSSPLTSSPSSNQPIAAQPVQARRPRIGLALGGGAARGFAHIGVITVLEAAGVVPEIVVGTSAGSLVGALYASGMNARQLREQALRLDERTLGDWQLGRGVIKGRALQDVVNRLVGGRRIEQFPRRFAATATDLYNGNLKVFTSGDCGLAVRASSSVPTIFEPVAFEGREYVDGGLVSPIPVRTARQLGAEFVIAVDISARPSFQATETTAQILLQTFAIMGRALAEQEMQLADIGVKPPVSDLGAASFESRNRSIEDGERAMRDQLSVTLVKLRNFQT